jgi:hypothetical protein
MGGPRDLMPPVPPKLLQYSLTLGCQRLPSGFIDSSTEPAQPCHSSAMSQCLRSEPAAGTLRTRCAGRIRGAFSRAWRQFGHATIAVNTRSREETQVQPGWLLACPHMAAAIAMNMCKSVQCAAPVLHGWPSVLGLGHCGRLVWSSAA